VLHGAGPSHASQTIVLEELGAGPTSIGVSLVVQFMGLQLLHTYGSAEQREQFLALKPGYPHRGDRHHGHPGVGPMRRHSG
jgi:hypothetical protein